MGHIKRNRIKYFHVMLLHLKTLLWNSLMGWYLLFLLGIIRPFIKSRDLFSLVAGFLFSIGSIFSLLVSPVCYPSPNNGWITRPHRLSVMSHPLLRKLPRACIPGETYCSLLFGFGWVYMCS